MKLASRGCPSHWNVSSAEQKERMKLCRNYIVVLFSAVLFAVGCNEPFSPKGPFEQKLVAYSVLSTQSDTQFVRLYLNYNPPGFDPYAVPTEVADTGARVTISSSSQNFAFYDTLLSPTLHAFVNPSFLPQRGTAYVLTATSIHGAITANTTMPSHGLLDVPNRSPLIFPSSSASGTIDVDVTLAPEARGFLVRFILYYGLASDSTFLGESEIPASYAEDASGVLMPVFPQLQRAVDPRPVVSFPESNYLQILTDLTDQHQTKIELKTAKFYLIQVDESLYNYYNIVNGFRDKYSIRTDQPDFTNIQNGLGVFGSFSTDSLVIRLF